MSSKGYLAIWAGSALLALAGCDAGNQQQQDPGSPATQDQSSDNMAMYEPDDSAGSQTDDPTTADDPYSTTDPSMQSEDPMLGADQSQNQSGMSGQSLESMSPDQIVGKTVVSAEGEEIGEVQEVVQDPAAGQKFAVVDVGGFLGVGQKSVVIALDELQTSSSGQDRLESNLTRETLETKSEYTPGEYEPVQETATQ
ncbi:MAG TPA: PRC-barrel domain-containing protein [Woeseiaceae bacterium]|nr:PRC-barrel domain-containing protein [Woeseiaceae bacterium]